jgi:guanylate kinase
MVQIICICGPSGVGKTSVLEELKKLDTPWSYPVSTTTRKPRVDEKRGEYYHFISDENFTSRLANGDFIEHAIVHGIQYGLQRVDLEAFWTQGIEKSILAVDIQGVRILKKLYPNVISIFLIPGSFSDLEERLQERITDKPDDIALRLANAKTEINEHKSECDWYVVNHKNNLITTVESIVNIIDG